MHKYGGVYVAAGFVCFLIGTLIRSPYPGLWPRVPQAEVDVRVFGDIGLLGSFDGNVMVEYGRSGEWDEAIREIGNVVYHPTLGCHLFFYSGHCGNYEGNNVFLGAAVSGDGAHWQKFGKLDLGLAAEDPYAVVFEGRIYLFFEDKEEIPFRRVSLAVSDDATHWDILKRGVIHPLPDAGWQSTDVSSPVVLRSHDQWVMLYEGRGPRNSGMVGYAYSTDLLEWTQSRDAVYSGGRRHWRATWDAYVVPDDVVFEEGLFWMTYHGCSNRNRWHSGVAVSRDLLHWETLNDHPIHPSNTLMLTKRDGRLLFISCMERARQVCFLKPLGIHQVNGDE